MSFLSWLTSSGNDGTESKKSKNPKKSNEGLQKDEQSDFSNTEFDEIATRFANLTTEVIELRASVARLQQQNQTQQTQIKGHLTQIQNTQSQHQNEVKELRTALSTEKSNLAALQFSVFEMTNGPRKLKELRRQGPVAPFQYIIQTEKDGRNADAVAARNQCTVLTNQCTMLNGEKSALQKQLGEMGIRQEELKLDIEFLKCTAVPSPVQSIPEKTRDVAGLDIEAPLPEVPFVLVLIDADAYVFAEMLPNSYSDPSLHPGARMAHNIKNYLLTYIASHGLPSQCKLLVRVMVNGTGFKSGIPLGFHRRDERVTSAIQDFMVRFTEYAPLFEFYDAGQGKERVDGKIHEMYHTFITNALCHKVFLGVARDNGFARMIEQHIHYPALRAKTCLISTGDIAAELQRLNLEIVEWPAVFARQFRPREALVREAKRENRRSGEEARAKMEKEAMIRQLGEAGYEEFVRRRSFQMLTKELIGMKTAQTLVQELHNFDKQLVGIRTDLTLAKDPSSMAEAESTDFHTHEELCCEVGVD